MTTPESAIENLLIDLKISTKKSIKPFFPRTRDRKDVSVLKCEKSGVILLSRSDHMNIEHYKNKVFNERGAKTRQEALEATAEDTKRRAKQFKKFIKNKRWMDVGTGAGGILDALAPLARDVVVAVEPQEKFRQSLRALNYKVYPLVNDVEESDFDVITLFHVLEHFTDPIGALKSMKQKLKRGGRIVVEVPHAGDFLISVLDNYAFKSHTFWS